MKINQSIDAKVCFAWTNNDCVESIDIGVTNCGNYYVYYLHETPNCDLRYCGADHNTTTVG